MRRRVLLTSVLGVAGCGLSERPYEQKREWPLVAARGTVLPANPRGPVLLIRTIQAGPGLESRGLRSLQADGSVRSEFYEIWAVPPAQAVEAAMREWLAGSGQFAAVLAPGSRIAADYILEGVLTDCVADPAKGVARMAMTLVVLDARNATTTLLSQHRLTADAPLVGTDTPAMVQATRAVLATMMADVERALTGLPRRG